MSAIIRVRMTVTEASLNTEGGQNIRATASLGGAVGFPLDRNLEARDAWERQDPKFRRGNPFTPSPNATYLSDNPSPFAHEASGTMDLKISRAGSERWVSKGSEIYVDIQVAGAPQSDLDAEAGRTLARNGQPLAPDANEHVRRGFAEHAKRVE